MSSSQYILPSRFGTPPPPTAPLNMFPTASTLNVGDRDTIALRQLILANTAVLDDGNQMVLCVHRGPQVEGKTNGPKAYMASLCIRNKNAKGGIILDSCHSGVAADSIIGALGHLFDKTADLVHQKVAAAYDAKIKEEKAVLWGKNG